jgi:signal peptidase I
MNDVPPSRSEQSALSYFKEILKFVIVAAIIVVPIRAFVAQPFIVSGSSMYPTFKNGQYLIVDEIGYDFHAPRRGDVIVFHYPKDPSKFFIIRIIGLPGETVDIHSKAYVSDEDAAKRDRINIWSGTFDMPWEWRARHRRR